MNSSTLFFLLTVFVVALAISVSAYPEEEEKGKKEEAKEGAGDKKEEEDGEKKKEEAEGSAMSLISSNTFSTVVSLAIASIILSIH